MKLKISADSFFERRLMVVRDECVEFVEGMGFSSKRRFGYDQIECVLLSPQDVLSFQVGNEVFNLAVRSYKPKHQQAIAALVANVRRANGLPA